MSLLPITEAEAKDLFDNLDEQYVTYESAFPGSIVEEA